MSWCRPHPTLEGCCAHGEPWYIAKGGTADGRRTCHVKYRARGLRYAVSEKGKAASRRLQRTPGTYKYNEAHGIGDAGAAMRMQQSDRRRRRRLKEAGLL